MAVGHPGLLKAGPAAMALALSLLIPAAAPWADELPTRAAAGQSSSEHRPRGIPGMGVWSRDLSRQERAALSPGEPGGVLVTHVAPGSPADAAGLRAGQRIVHVDGQVVPNDKAFGAFLAARPAWSAVRLDLREGSVGSVVSLKRAEQLSYLGPACQAGDGSPGRSRRARRATCWAARGPASSWPRARRSRPISRERWSC